jgi:hypothetical protein
VFGTLAIIRGSPVLLRRAAYLLGVDLLHGVTFGLVGYGFPSTPPGAVITLSLVFLLLQPVGPGARRPATARPDPAARGTARVR